MINLSPNTIGRILNVYGYFFKEKTGGLLLKIFCKPREGKILPEQEEFLNTCETTAMIPHKQGVVKSYTWNGAGAKTILLLHGWESNAARWHFLIPKLIQNNLKVIAIDAPAHGASSSNFFDMIQYSDAIKATVDVFNPHYMIGHSLGGASMCYYFGNFNTPAFEKIVLMGVPSELRHMAQHFSDALGLSKRMESALDAAFKSKYHIKIETISAATFCQKIKIPTLLIHDKADEVAMVSDSILYHKVLADSELMLTEGLGHSLQDEKVFDRIINRLVTL